MAKAYSKSSQGSKLKVFYFFLLYLCNFVKSWFDEKLPDLKVHALVLFTEWMVCYQSVPGGVIGGMRCCCRGG